jgi:hypothetical protein
MFSECWLTLVALYCFEVPRSHHVESTVHSTVPYFPCYRSLPQIGRLCSKRQSYLASPIETAEIACTPCRS